MAEPFPKIKVPSVIPPAAKVSQRLPPSVAGLSNSSQIALERHRSLAVKATLPKTAPNSASGGRASTFPDTKEPACERNAAARGAAPASREQDITGSVRWHMEIEPGSGVIQKDTLLTIWLRNVEGVRGDFHGGWPRVTLRTATGRTQTMFMEGPPPRDLLQDARGYRLWYAARESGPLEIAVDATPNGTHGGLTVPTTPLKLVTYLDVTEGPTDEAIASKSAAERQESAYIEDPSTSPGAIGQAFRRASTRRAIEIVIGNLAEAEELKKLYTNLTTGPEEMARLADAVAVDLHLESERVKWVSEAERQGQRAERMLPEYGTDLELEDRRNEVALDAADAANTVAALDEARRLLVETVPALGLLRLGHQQRRAVAGRGREQQAAIMVTIDKLIADCKTTLTALASGRLDAMASPAFVAEMRAELGINADARRSAAVDAMLDRRRSESLNQMVGVIGLELLLLLVPGVGPFLSVAISAVGAGLAWREALDVLAATGAGVTSEPEAEDAALGAILETLLAGLGISLELKALKHMKVPKARFRGRLRARTPSRKARRKDPTLHGSIAPYRVYTPGYQRHEVLSNVWLETNRYVKTRLTGYASRQNPTLALTWHEHVIVNRYQRNLGLHDPAKVATMSYRQILRLNTVALEGAGVPQTVIGDIMRQARAHALEVIRRGPVW